MRKNECSPSILLVEDNPVQQMIMRLLCEKFGFSVFIVASGDEALRVLETGAGCYDAIVMDWRMPTMSGLDTTCAIRQIESRNGGHTPIIAVTANAMVGDREKCLAAGMDDYLSKPFTSVQFRDMLSGWIYGTVGPSLKLLPDFTQSKTGNVEC